MANSPPGRDTTENCRWTPIGVLSDPLKVTVLLLEYVLKEYVGGLAAEWHTYIEELVALPVTVRTTKTTRLIQIHANPRQPERMKQLHAAMAEVNRRALQSGKHKLRFELVDTP